MEEMVFDRWTMRLGRFVSRRATVGVLGAITAPRLVSAKKRKRKKRKAKKQKVVLNQLGCVNVGNFCQNGEQCCSGACRGKRGKQTCRSHDAGSGCQAGQSDGCAGNPSDCLTSTGHEGGCDTTTGNAGYCGYGFVCAACSKDVECQDLCGLEAAACVTCPDCDGTSTYQTACVGPSPGDCQQALSPAPGQGTARSLKKTPWTMDRLIA